VATPAAKASAGSCGSSPMIGSKTSTMGSFSGLAPIDGAPDEDYRPAPPKSTCFASQGSSCVRASAPCCAVCCPMSGWMQESHCRPLWLKGGQIKRGVAAQQTGAHRSPGPDAPAGPGLAGRCERSRARCCRRPARGSVQAVRTMMGTVGADRKRGPASPAAAPIWGVRAWRMVRRGPLWRRERGCADGGSGCAVKLLGLPSNSGLARMLQPRSTPDARGSPAAPRCKPQEPGAPV
jgi:hypothetical protein